MTVWIGPAKTINVDRKINRSNRVMQETRGNRTVMARDELGSRVVKTRLSVMNKSAIVKRPG